MTMLEIKNLHARVEGKEILKGVDLTINAGEVHAIMGPNGSGKSTLAGVLAGRADYEITEGEVLFEGQDLLELDPEERAREGIFLAFQYPVEIPGVNNTYFLKAALNAIRKSRGEEELDAVEFLALVREKMRVLHIDQSLLNRPVNEGFSGGEKKRNEIFQMAVLSPKLAILDETDSGLDIDAALEHVLRDVQRLGDLADLLQESGRGVFGLAPRLALRVDRRLQEIVGGDAGNLDRILEREEHACGGAFVRLHLQQVFAVEQDLAAGDFVAGLAGDDMRERRFAGAVRPHDRVHLALVHGQRQPMEDFAILNTHLQVLHFQQCHINLPRCHPEAPSLAGLEG